MKALNTLKLRSTLVLGVAALFLGTTAVTAVAQEIKAKMAAFGITIDDLNGGGKTRVRKAGAAKSGNPAPAKYRGPNGETWSGRGLMPRWLAALVAQGQSKESFAI